MILYTDIFTSISSLSDYKTFNLIQETSRIPIESNSGIKFGNMIYFEFHSTVTGSNVASTDIIAAVPSTYAPSSIIYDCGLLFIKRLNVPGIAVTVSPTGYIFQSWTSNLLVGEEIAIIALYHI